LLADELPLCPSIRLRLADGEPVDPPPWLEQLPRPLVYATMGTVFNRPASFAPLVDGLAGAGVGALLTVGRNLDPSELGDVPPAIRVEQFVPQRQVLASCAAVVSHGGSGTVLGALAAGLPLVLLPQGADQFENATRCERAGAAVVLAPDEVTGDAVAAALRLVLSKPAYAEAARVIAAEFAEMGTAEEAAGAVEEHMDGR
jgi:MGT family glycosyltransferase